MGKFNVRRALGAASVLAIAAYGFASPAQAQASAAAPGGDAATAPVGAIEEVVVTAQRREQRLQEAPVAVTALSAKALDQLNVSDTRDLMQVVPSLQVSTQTSGDNGGSATFFLRGMGQQRSGNGSEPAVGIYVDDFYYPSLSGTILDIVDLQQVEVLRGPQGTLFGRNTIGGAIRYTTRNAELGRFSGHVTGTIGSNDRYDISGAVNIPIGEKVAIRLSGGRLDQGGYVHVQSGGKDSAATRTDLVRFQMLAQPTSRLTVDLSAEYSKSRLDGFAYNVPGPLTPVPPAPGAAATLTYRYNTTIAGPAGTTLYSDAFRSTCFYCQYGTNFPEFSETTYKNALAKVEWDLGGGLTLKSLSGWQSVANTNSNDIDSSPLPIYTSGINRSQTYAFSQEVQLSGKLLDDRLNFVSGAYYYNERQPARMPLRPNLVLAQPGVVTLSDRKLKSYAAFVDGSFKITEQLSVLAGFRYSEDHKQVHARSVAGAPLADGSAEFGSSTYRVGLQYQWTPDIMTYANIATGFRAGGFNPYNASQHPSLLPFDPEKAKSYEAGARMQFLDRRITLNPTVFYVDWTQIQVQAVAIDTVNGGSIIALQNAGAARSYGAELEGSAAITDHLRIFGNLAYLDLKYTSIGKATGITLDTKLQRAPKWTASIGASQTFELSSGASVVATVNYSYQDDQYSTPTDLDKLLLPAYSLTNARVEYRDQDDRYRLSAYVTNAFGKHYVIGGVNYYNNIAAARYDLGKPREVGLTARFNF